MVVGPRNRREDSQRSGTMLYDRRPAPAPPLAVGDRAGSRSHQPVPARTRLREREGFLEELRASFHGLSRVGPIMIQGESGLGKTALLNAACRMAREEQLSVLCARGSLLETSFSFGVVRQLFEPILSLLDPVQREQCLNELGAGVLSGTGPKDIDDLSAVLDGIRSAVSFLAESQPVVLAIDDLDLCDRESALWFEYMSRRLEHRKVWLLGTTSLRSDTRARPTIDQVIADPATRSFILEPLSTSSVAELVAEQFGGSGLEALIDECHFATRGNPFLLFSLLTWLRVSGLESCSAAAREVANAVPQAVIRSMVSRAHSLPPGSYPLLQAVTVLRSDAGLRETSALVNLDIENAKVAADALAEANILGRERPLSFVYPLEASAVYADMGPAGRANLHALAAQLLHNQGSSSGVVGDHLLLTEPAAEGWRAECLVEAAKSAGDEGRYERAHEYLTRALAEAPGTILRGSALMELASVEASMGSIEAVSYLRAAGDLEVEPTSYGHKALQVVKALANEVSPAAALEVVRLASTRLQDSDEAVLRMRLELLVAHFDRTIGGGVRAAAALEKSLAGRLVGRNRDERLALAHLCGFWVLLPDRLGATQLGATALQSIAGEDLEVADAIAVEGMVRALEAATFAGYLTDVEQIARNRRTTAQRLGVAATEAAFATVLAHVLFQGGNLREAESEARRALAITNGSARSRWPLILSAKISLEQGQRAQAVQLIDELCRLEEGSESLDEILAMECRGELHYADGATETALSDFQVAGQLAEEWNVKNPAVTGWRAGRARTLYAIGDFRASHELASENLSLARVFGSPLHVGAALRVMAEVVEPTERLALLDEAVNLLEPTGAILELSHATLDLGRTLRESGRHVAARTALRQAADLAVRCGSSRLIDQSLRELRASGARPRRLAFSGTDALTPSERRVAELAASGMKNARIAEELFVSTKTVEGHLSRTYQKLGIQSRDELRSVVSSLRITDDPVTRMTRDSA